MWDGKPNENCIDTLTKNDQQKTISYDQWEFVTKYEKQDLFFFYTNKKNQRKNPGERSEPKEKALS